MTFKIQKYSNGNTTTIRLIGRIQSEQLEQLKAETADVGSRVILDLSEVTLVDVEVICFLSDCEDKGIEVIHCSPYIKEWIRRELDARKK
jgi:anti-anti-sigma regulatory factor